MALYRMPFRVTNGSACFQRIMDDFVSKYKLRDTFPFIDNLTICEKDQNDHDMNLEKFEIAAKSEGLTMNEEKCVYSTTLDFLGYRISHNTLSPDPERLAPLLNLPIPTDQKSLKRIVGVISLLLFLLLESTGLSDRHFKSFLFFIQCNFLNDHVSN
ncbi:Hypothetical predicted protein [Octopus vulgaris]|uniref:Reverse transcriptase domain-containing protein n=1 Tax=Octopus vulgaris TaxID=6645 RepID=A0AA36BBE8_OCTVU|nr:Hypothetical predicted protein [Octopus vulgaris]